MAALSQMGYNVPAGENAESMGGFSSGFSSAPPMMGVATGGTAFTAAASYSTLRLQHLHLCPAALDCRTRSCSLPPCRLHIPGCSPLAAPQLVCIPRPPVHATLDALAPHPDSTARPRSSGMQPRPTTWLPGAGPHLAGREPCV